MDTYCVGYEQQCILLKNHDTSCKSTLWAVDSVSRWHSATLSDSKLLHKTFEAVWNAINNKYYDSTFGGVDWVAVRKKYEPQIESARSDGESNDLLSRMLKEIKISHLSILDLKNLDKLLARAEVSRF